ncbi:DUF1289 domain-containing protein [Trinickia sp.]
MAVKSPCIDVCAFDGKTGLCIGCREAGAAGPGQVVRGRCQAS